MDALTEKISVYEGGVRTKAYDAQPANPNIIDWTICEYGVGRCILSYIKQDHGNASRRKYIIRKETSVRHPLM